MIAHVPRPHLSLHALIAEAKRRARRRRAVLAIAVIALAGGGTGAIVETHPFGWLRPAVADAALPAVNYRQEMTGNLSNVSAASRNAAWVVGNSFAWRWNGTAWRNVPLPASNISLSRVDAVASNDVWAVGTQQWEVAAPSHVSTGVSEAPVIEHWNGRAWSAVWSGGLRTSLSSISATGPRNIWALGTVSVRRGPKLLLLHWDGHAWLKQLVPWERPGELEQVKLVATGQSGVWVVSLGLAHLFGKYWNGARWQTVPRPFGTRDYIADFSATAGNDAWVVGSHGTIGNIHLKYSHPLAAHWNGSAWTVTRVPAVPSLNNSYLDSVAAAGPNSVWAIGWGYHIGRTVYRRPGSLRALLLHWNGSRWSVEPGSARHIYPIAGGGIAAAADGSAWAIGSCGRDNVVLGWNGAKWRVVPHPRDLRWAGDVPASVRRRGFRTCRG